MKPWMLETMDTYFANPTARRDFRTQLRGIKPMLLWSIYLLFLIFVGMSFYGSLEVSGDSSLSSLQYRLKEFYGLVLGLLAAAVTVITPALTASAIASERQRRSLDLVLSTPLHIKSYLVGKLIASYRYTWMLLVLSLPLVSMCVILGGATWQEVILAYVRLSLFGLLFTAVGLLMSVLAPRPVSAIAYSYIAVAFYVLMTTLLAGVGFGYGTENYALASLNPFFDAMMISSNVTYDSALIAWLPLAAFVAFACKVLLLGAGSALGGYASKHTVYLRWHLLVMCMAIIGAVAYHLPASFLMASAGGGMAVPTAVSSPSAGVYGPGFDVSLAISASGILCYAAILLHWMLPFAACYSPFAERRFHNDGIFYVRRAFLGTPSGALPYLLIVIVCAVAATLLVLFFAGVPLAFKPFVDGVAWTVAFLVMVWAICRFVSSISRNLTTARGGTYVLLVCLLLLPTPVLQAMAEIDGTGDIWKVHPFHSALAYSQNRLSMALVMILVAAVFLLLSLRKPQAVAQDVTKVA